MVVSGLAWLVVTSAPTVERERPMRPLIGAGTVVNLRLMRAVSSAARACATEALAWAACAAALT